MRLAEYRSHRSDVGHCLGFVVGSALPQYGSPKNDDTLTKSARVINSVVARMLLLSYHGPAGARGGRNLNIACNRYGWVCGQAQRGGRCTDGVYDKRRVSGKAVFRWCSMVNWPYHSSLQITLCCGMLECGHRLAMLILAVLPLDLLPQGTAILPTFSKNGPLCTCCGLWQ